MKILHIYTGGGEIYGAERVIINLVSEQIKCSTTPEVVYFKRPGQNSFLELLNDHRIPVQVVHSHSKLDLNAFMELRGICLRSSPQILHSHGYKGDIFLALLKRTISGSALVSTKHGSTDASHKIKIYDYLGDRALKYFDRVIAVSQFTKNRLIERGIHEEKITVIQNGIDIAPFEHFRKGKLREELNLEPGARVVGFIGRLGPEKGITYLLEAARIICSSMSGVYFVLAGEGILREEAEEFIASNGLSDRIVMLGWRKDATELLPDMDILLLPSLTEGTPMVLLESMAMGVPVIASDVGGIGEVIEDSMTGLLVKPKDPKALANSINTLLGNAGLAGNISRNSIAEIKSRFTASHMSKQYEQTYLSLLKERKTR